MLRDAVISPCGQYRYALWRTWDQLRPLTLFICLNPSTADARVDDPTLRRCMSLAKKWGYGGVSIGNLFAFRSSDPKVLKAARSPVGPENDKWLRKLVKEADLKIAAWGNHGTFMNRAEEILGMFSGFKCLGINRSAQPKHPLYCASDVRLKKYHLEPIN